MGAPERVLVLRRGGLGDTLLLAPVLRALRRAYPGAWIDFAGVREFAAVLVQAGLADGARSSEDLALWSLAGCDAGTARARLACYRRIVADDPVVRVVAGASTAVQCFDPRPRDRRPLGQQFAAALGLPLSWPEDAWLAPAPPSASGPVLLAPGSGGRAKCWPRACWIALARTLADAGERLQGLLGPVERERDDPRAWPWPVAIDWLAPADATALAAALAGVRGFVGNDSGPTHLAAMLGVPTVALFGPSDPAVFGPVGPVVRVVTAPGPGIDSLLPAAVAAAVVEVLAPRR